MTSLRVTYNASLERTGADISYLSPHTQKYDADYTTTCEQEHCLHQGARGDSVCLASRQVIHCADDPLQTQAQKHIHAVTSCKKELTKVIS